LILAHDKVRLRERQVERFIELAAKLRTLNNYVGLRAVKTGINNATFPNDEIMTMLRDNKLKLYQMFLGWEILLNSASNHRAYRMAIRHTSGPGIPDMFVFSRLLSS
jgi:RasGEF domain